MRTQRSYTSIKTPLNKCALLGCDLPAEPDNIGCSQHPNIRPNQAVDNLPAMVDHSETLVGLAQQGADQFHRSLKFLGYE